MGDTSRLKEGLRLDLSVDAFNFLNRSNVDEVTSVYGSPVFCGGAIPQALQRCYQPRHSGRIGCGMSRRSEFP